MQIDLFKVLISALPSHPRPHNSLTELGSPALTKQVMLIQDFLKATDTQTNVSKQFLKAHNYMCELKGRTCYVNFIFGRTENIASIKCAASNAWGKRVKHYNAEQFSAQWAYPRRKEFCSSNKFFSFY